MEMHIENDLMTSIENARAHLRTPVPSDWQHAKILMARTLRCDRKKPKLWFARFVGMGLLLMLYTLGFFLNYEGGDESSTVEGDYRLFEGTEWEYPTKMRLSGFDDNVTSRVGALLVSDINLDFVESNNNSTLFQLNCSSNIAASPAEEVCVFLDTNESYSLYYGGKEDTTPFSPNLAAAQWAVNHALLQVSGSNSTLFEVSQIQRTPLLVNDDGEADVAVLLVPGIMHVLSALIMVMFLIGPITYEKLNGVSRSFLSAGVKMRTYLLQWLVYYSLNGILTAGILTLVAVYYRLFPQSNAGLIFVSHYLGLVETYASFILIMQFIEQEELAQGLPWIYGIASMAAGGALLVSQEPDSILLTILSSISPFVGMIQYYGIYISYDSTGFDTGIHPGDNVVESGLLANMITQICGILFWVISILIYSSPRFHQWLRKHHNNNESDGHDAIIDADNFEPLPRDSDVLLSVRGLEHTYMPPRFSCNNNAKPTEVLKGLDMDICRGEVFGYLGHNGAGKSTSINILASELQLQQGKVMYHLHEGAAELANSEAEVLIRSKIGVCPQHNTTLQDDLTCRETLRLFAHLKGGIVMEQGQMIEEAVEAEVNRRLEDVHFTSEEDGDKEVGTYSGGMKRKVLIAIALLGDPEVVFLDEPTAGLDPYNRRTIWDMIIAAKKGRSIILTTHFLDEADVLSDRIGIIKNGKLIACGSSLFLKHHFGIGYRLSFDSSEPFDVGSVVRGAKNLNGDTPGSHKWQLGHGSEPMFTQTLEALRNAGASNVSLELTTLEQVFLETGKEESEGDDTEDSDEEPDDISGDESPENIDVENPEHKAHYLSMIWERRGNVQIPTFLRKFLLVQHFMMTNAWKIKGTIFLNIAMPLIYLVVGMVVVAIVAVPSDTGELVLNEPIALSPSVAGNNPSQFFGIPMIDGVDAIFPVQPANVPDTIADYFVDRAPPFIGGHYGGNTTLQYDPELSKFALQIGAMILSNYTAILDTNRTLGGIATTLQQLPYISAAPYRFDTIILPMCIAFGFSGMAFVVLDILLLKGDNIVGLFRVNGIDEWMTYLGVMMYKCTSTFLPFFLLVIILGSALQIVLLGNGGRWLGTVLLMLGYAYSTTPMGLILAKRFITSDFKSVANWFPGVYMTLVGLPYVAWASVLQALPESRDVILIVGDVLCVVPMVAFQRGLGAVMEITTVYKDETLTWGDVWKFETRVWFTILMMLLVGTFEWMYLRKLTTTREPRTKLISPEEVETVAAPVDVSHDPDIFAEKERSLADDEGINARELVKCFRVKASKESKSKEPILKRAVKGVSYGIRKNEIFALLGPNGAGKTVTMSILAGEYAPEYGEIALDGAKATGEQHNLDHLYQKCNVSYCPQFNALFPRKTVEEHLRFYASVRGLDWEQESTQQHINAIIKLLGLGKHKHKESTELSGGYKRRLSLGVAILGYPTVMMADECTTGLDPAARRLVWDVLKPDIDHCDYDIPAILLSSHYMDECQQLGTRIGIMIDGEVKTVGSLKRLQELYCTSYFVEISLQAQQPSGEDAEQRLLETFDEHEMPATVYESLPYHLKLKVPFIEGAKHNDTRQLAQIFDMLETNKERLGIKFYSVALMNLEQIFIDLSRKQFEADEEFETNLSTRQIG